MSKGKFNKKKAISLALVITILAANLLFISMANAESQILVLLNNKNIVFDVPPTIINDRIMIPFRKIGEAMGASGDWDSTNKKVTMHLGSRYVILQIGNPVMQYGSLKPDASGKNQIDTVEYYELEATPIIHNDRALVPIRAVVNGLGAKVEWRADLRTVLIETAENNAPKPSNSNTAPTPSPSATPKPTDSAFATTEYFQEISGMRAQDMYEGKNKFILFYYNSSSNSVKDSLKTVTNAARDAGYKKIYGVDENSTQYASNNKLSWIWTHISKTSTPNPVLFFVYEGGAVEKMESFSSGTNIKDKIKAFSEAKSTPKPTSTATTSPSPTPTTTAVTSTELDRALKFANGQDIERYYFRGDKFIVWYINSLSDANATNSDAVSKVREAAALEGIYIHYVEHYYDTYRPNELLNIYAANYAVDKASIRPVMFFVSGSTANKVVVNSDEIKDVDALRDKIKAWKETT